MSGSLDPNTLQDASRAELLRSPSRVFGAVRPKHSKRSAKSSVSQRLSSRVQGVAEQLVRIRNRVPFASQSQGAAPLPSSTSQSSLDSLVACRVWGNTADPQFTYPEDAGHFPFSRERQDVGLALSGGGVRAALQAHGYLRALHRLGLLHRVKCMSCSSGGSWTATCLAYGDGAEDLDDFFGEYIPPSRCSLELFRGSELSKLESVLLNSNFVGNGLRKLAGRAFTDDPRDLWSLMVGHAFLAPFDLDRPFLLPCLEGDHELRVRPLYSACNFEARAMRSNVPFIIVNGSVNVGGEAGFVPIEFTPLYYGIPVVHELDDSKGEVSPSVAQPMLTSQ